MLTKMTEKILLNRSGITGSACKNPDPQSGLTPGVRSFYSVAAGITLCFPKTNCSGCPISTNQRKYLTLQNVGLFYIAVSKRYMAAVKLLIRSFFSILAYHLLYPNKIVGTGSPRVNAGKSSGILSSISVFERWKFDER